MMMMQPRLLLLIAACALTVAAFAEASASASVPAVLVASPRDQLDRLSPDLPSRLTSTQLAEALRAATVRGVLLVVTCDDGLSLADFSTYGEAATTTDATFANVASLSAKLGGRHLLVTDAGQLLTTLRGLAWSGGAPVEAADAAGVVEAAAAASGGASGPRLVTARAADAAAADRLLGAASVALQSRGLPFVAVYTAARTSDDASAAVAASASGRRLLAAPATTSNPANNGTYVNCQNSVLMFYRGLRVRLTVSGVEKLNVQVPPAPDASKLIDTALSRCNAPGGNRTLVLTYRSPDAVPPPLASLSLSISLIAASPRGFWKLDSALVSLACLTTNNCSRVDNAAVPAKSLADLASPNGTCFHCTAGFAMRADAGNGTVVSLEFAKFQFQAFGVPASGGFSSSVNDCVGFFSVEIWFSLFVIAVVTLILMYGVLMLVSVATPDRFDDPKGKTIQVNVQEGN